MTKFLLDSGDPKEYRDKPQLWGSTTNPSLIAKKLASAGKKLTRQEAFALQKKLVLEIVNIVPGAVSAEVYADQETKAEDMVLQGKEIASWHERVVVKLPTNLEGFKARTELRKLGITINNTLVFSQEQIFAIALHEKIMRRDFGAPKSGWPCFISPFIGRLDDKGQNGMDLIKHGIDLVKNHFDKETVWMLAASIRNLTHIKVCLEQNVELITVPAKLYDDWFVMTLEDQEKISSESPSALSPIPVWTPTDEFIKINSLEEFMDAISSNKLNISHPLTTAGIDKFTQDWQEILQ